VQSTSFRRPMPVAAMPRHGEDDGSGAGPWRWCRCYVWVIRGKRRLCPRCDERAWADRIPWWKFMADDGKR